MEPVDKGNTVPSHDFHYITAYAVRLKNCNITYIFSKWNREPSPCSKRYGLWSVCRETCQKAMRESSVRKSLPRSSSRPRFRVYLQAGIWYIWKINVLDRPFAGYGTEMERMMRKMTVVVPALTAAQRERLQEKAHAYGFSAAFFEDNLSAYRDAADAEIIYGQGADLARAGQSVKWMCSPSAGVDMYCREGVFHSEDVLLTNSRGSYGVTISEHIIMVTLMLLRRQMEYAENVRKKAWVQTLPISSILGSRITIVGTGNIGTETARRYRAFSPECIIGVNRSGNCSEEQEILFDEIRTREDLHELLPETDILVLCVPGTSATARMIDSEALALMKKSAVLINVGRGSAVDQAALVSALRAGRIGAAALDVFEKEPVPEDDPVWECPNLLMTTHVSGNMSLPWTVEENLKLFLEDLDNYVHGRKLARLVDRSVGY